MLIATAAFLPLLATPLAPFVIAGTALVGAVVYRKEIVAAATELVATAKNVAVQGVAVSSAAITAVVQAAQGASTGAAGANTPAATLPTAEQLQAAEAARLAARAAQDAAAAAAAQAGANNIAANPAAAQIAASAASVATTAVAVIPAPTPPPTTILPVPPPPIIKGVTRIEETEGGSLPPGNVQAIWSESAKVLRFPSNLGEDTRRFPFVWFTAKSGSRKDIFLPIPMGLAFSDNMAYSTLDLGIIGSAVSKATAAAVSEGGFFSARGAGGALGAAGGTFINQMRSANGAAVVSLAARQTGFDNLANFVDFGAKQVIAPNTNTAFQNSMIRQFQFSFKMMPTNKGEANTITEIVKRFRQNMYPIANDLILTYPPIWNIKFYDGYETNENKKLPGIYDCYLIGMSTVYNNSGNMFHADGHPVETDVQLTFEETRALTLTDIADLSENRP